jgi:hypothetical protein
VRLSATALAAAVAEDIAAFGMAAIAGRGT